MSKRRRDTGGANEVNPIDYIHGTFTGTFLYESEPAFELIDFPIDLPFTRNPDGTFEVTEVIGVQVDVFRIEDMNSTTAGNIHYVFHNCPRTVTAAIPASIGYREVWHTGHTTLNMSKVEWINPNGDGYLIVQPRLYCTLWVENMSTAFDFNIGGLVKIWFKRKSVSNRVYARLVDQQKLRND